MPTVPEQVDAVRYPRLARYLGALPQGFASYPECQIKGFYFRESWAALNAPTLGAAWPEPLRKLIASPPSNSQFMPEVLFCSYRLAVADEQRLSQAAYETWVLGNSRRIYRNFLGKLIMAFASKQMLLDAAGSRWAMIHRGSTFAAKYLGNGTYEGRLDFPAHLFDEPILRGLGGVMQAAFELVEKPGFVLKLMEFEPTWARYETHSAPP